MFGINLEEVTSSMKTEMNKFHKELAEIHAELKAVRKSLNQMIKILIHPSERE